MPNWKKLITSGSDASLNSLNLSSVVNAGTDTDKFLVLDSSGNVDFRTGENVLSDIGAQGSGNYVVDAGGASCQVGVWSSGTDMSGSNSLFFNTSTNKLGIGTNSPDHTLHVSTADQTVSTFQSTGYAAPRLKILGSTDGTTFLHANVSCSAFGPGSGLNNTCNLILHSSGFLGYGGVPNVQYQSNFHRDWNTSEDTPFSSYFANVDISGTDTLTGDKTISGFNADIDSSATGGNTSQELRIAGLQANIDDSGDANDVYGVCTFVRNKKTDASIDRVTQVYGGLLQAVGQNSAGCVSNVRGLSAIGCYTSAGTGSGALGANFTGAVI